jgi:hypothetical protein
MFNLLKRDDSKNVKNAVAQQAPAPVKEVIRSSNNNLKIGSVKHLMATAIVTNQAINATADMAAKKEEIAEIKIKTPEVIAPIVAETPNTIEAKLAPVEITVDEPVAKAEFKPFTQIAPEPMEKKEAIATIPKNVCTWFVNNLSNYMNGLPIEKENDFHTLMNELTQNDELNQAPSHIGLHKVKHFIKTQMGHMFDTARDEFITINLPALDKGVMLMGPTPDNNIVLAGNLSSLETSDWDNIHKSLQAQIA